MGGHPCPAAHFPSPHSISQIFYQAGTDLDAGSGAGLVGAGVLDIDSPLPEKEVEIVYDPQTSGGLLVAVAGDEADECGGVCKDCAASAKCVSSGSAWICCTPDCANKACGADDGCGGILDCGSCPSGQICDPASGCTDDACTSGDCTDVYCGDDFNGNLCTDDN